MKNIFKTLFAAFMAVAMVTFVSCGKVDDGGNGTEQPTPTPNPNPQPTVNWVDLGFPSGLLWADCNVGATNPEDYGDYFAWGETTTKDNYTWSTYRYCTVDGNGELATLTKYNTTSTYGTPDNLTTLQPADDAATARLNGGARTPTKAEWEELMGNTTAEWTTLNGVDGRKFTAPNGKSIFLPAAGYHYGTELQIAGSAAGYWSASLNTDFPNCVPDFYFSSGGQSMDLNYRYYGFSVRAVRDR